eukprot:1863439-Amphidinium_carterae.1
MFDSHTVSNLEAGERAAWLQSIPDTAKDALRPKSIPAVTSKATIIGITRDYMHCLSQFVSIG